MGEGKVNDDMLHGSKALLEVAFPCINSNCIAFADSHFVSFTTIELPHLSGSLFIGVVKNPEKNILCLAQEL